MFTRGYLPRTDKEERIAMGKDLAKLSEEHATIIEVLIAILKDGPGHYDEFLICLEELEETEAKIKELREAMLHEF